MEYSLDTEAQYLKGVGPHVAKSLERLRVRTVRDLLYAIPRRYEDRRNVPPIANARPGQWATIRGRLVDFEARPTRRGMVILKAAVSDGSGVMVLTWFNQPWVRKALGTYHGEIVAYGLVKEASWGYEINSPEYETLGEDQDAEDFTRIMPVYPLTEGLGQKTVRRAVRSALSVGLEIIEEPLPLAIRKRYGLRDIRTCLREVHNPTEEEARLAARRRLAFEDFLYLQLALAMRRVGAHAESGLAFPLSKLISPPGAGAGAPSDAAEGLFEGVLREARESEPLWTQIHRMLPFELTKAQRRVIGEIFRDMESPHPMNRLVQGDVGSGKTAVAACAILAAVRCGYQAAIMAPTEILAEQHFANFHRLFQPLGLEVGLLVGKQTAKQKEKACARVAEGKVSIAVGTHALIQEGVTFKHLGFVVIDEQHRFGVLHRKALREKGLGNPDVLVMTATPIPRTLTMTLYGDLDLSVIDELPPGRKPIKTHWKPQRDRDGVYDTVKKLLEEGRQAYVVCPLVGESEKIMAQAATDLHYRLSNGPLADLRVGLLHGQMKAKDKEDAMDRFRRRELDVLVSTTVIEVGVDVPNATLMIVEDANRFGLSQLHQLRGRVGRGAHQSFCILIADATTDDAEDRMRIMVETSDGFRIAEADLKLRGPGSLLGTEQHGRLDFLVADLVQDGAMLELARDAAQGLVSEDPNLTAKENRMLRARVRERYADLALVSIS